MNAEQVFVDTDVLVYATLSSAPFHADAIRALKELRARGVKLWVSQQVIREYIATVTRPQSYSRAVPLDLVIEQVHRLRTEYAVAEETAAVLDHLLTLLRTTPTAGKQVHDANIVATMLANNLTHLLTHNTADFNRFADRITITPLIAEESA